MVPLSKSPPATNAASSSPSSLTITTVIAKKEGVKTQISYAANLYGLCVRKSTCWLAPLVYASYSLGDEFHTDKHVRYRGHSFEEVLALSGSAMVLQPEGYAVDKRFPEIIYVSRDVRFDLQRQTVTWPSPEGDRVIKLLADKIYVRPSGYKVQMEKPPGNNAWRLVGTVAEGVLCQQTFHSSPAAANLKFPNQSPTPFFKAPFSSPISKRISTRWQSCCVANFSKRFKDPAKNGTDKRPVLSSERSLGSVIKLFTPSELDYSPEFNQWLSSIPQYLLELIFVIKRFYKPEWGDNWREHFTVDIINGTPGNELKCDNRKLISNFLRVGYDSEGAWRVFGVRQDFHPATKLQVEDDITASVVVPAAALKHLNPDYSHGSLKCREKLRGPPFPAPG